jgi:hypothetical protein
LIDILASFTATNSLDLNHVQIDLYHINHPSIIFVLSACFCPGTSCRPYLRIFGKPACVGLEVTIGRTRAIADCLRNHGRYVRRRFGTRQKPGLEKRKENFRAKQQHSDKSAKDAKGLKLIRHEKDYAIFEAGSGKYQFVSEIR